MVTQKMADKYVGGQMEIQNQIEEYIYRGEVAKVDVVGEELKVEFAWMAKGVGYPLPARWVNDENKTYGVNLMTASANEDDLNRLIINTGFISNELIVFFPPDGSKLDPAKIEGLQL